MTGVVVRGPKWSLAQIAPDLFRLDTYEESLGQEWRGSVLLDDDEARRLSTDLARMAGKPKERG